MGLFSRKKKEGTAVAAPKTPTAPLIPEKPVAPSGVPLEQVNRMRQQGVADNQIVQTLQRNGYKSHQVFDAMNQADLTPGTPRHTEQTAVPPKQSLDPGYPDMYQDDQAFEAPTQESREYEDFEQPQAQEMQEFGTSEMDRIEEVAEAIIDEKWSELMKNIKKIIEWKERVDARVNSLEQQMNDLKISLNELNKSLVERMGEYDRSMSSVGTEIKAMEKVFQKMLPTFTENISELSRITKDIKRD